MSHLFRPEGIHDEKCSKIFKKNNQKSAMNASRKRSEIEFPFWTSFCFMFVPFWAQCGLQNVTKNVIKNMLKKVPKKTLPGPPFSPHVARGGVGTGYIQTYGTYDTPPVIAVPGPPRGGSRRGHGHMTFPHASLTRKGSADLTMF